MGRFLVSLIASLLALPSIASDPPSRPKILGISGVGIRVNDFCRAHNFYSQALGKRPNCPPGGRSLTPSGGGLVLWSEQSIMLNVHSFYSYGAPSKPETMLEEIAFVTDDAVALHHYLESHGVEARDVGAQPPSFVVRDPEGHRIAFIERKLPPEEERPRVAPFRQTQILHAGFVVKDLAAENRFYADLLGFRLYWHGGFKDDSEDWYELQVPDGTDWIEYMLNIPADADKKELGIQNHISLGVKDIHATADQLRKNGITNFDGPEVGRDGKWSLDAYDPDGTRVEFMEFTPVQPPCCHPYTAAHPKP